MTRHAEGTFHVEAWNEAPYADLEGGGKLARAAVTQRYRGAIEGSGTVEYLMCHPPGGGTVRFVGHERVHATLDGREGAFVIQHQGAFEGGVASCEWEIVPGSGTGGLEGLSGRGTYTTTGHGSAEYAVEYDLP